MLGKARRFGQHCDEWEEMIIMAGVIRRKHLVIATSAFAVLAAAFWMSSGSGPEHSEAANEQAKTEIHLEIDGSLGTGPVHCDSRTQTTCKLVKGSTFALQVIPNAIPVGGYTLMQSLIEYGSLLYKPTEDPYGEFTWPEAVFTVRAPTAPTGKEGSVGHAGVTALVPPLPASFQKTTLVTLTFNCSENDQTPGQSHSNLIRLVDFNESPSGAYFLLADGITTTVPNVGSLTIECTVAPTATPTPMITPTPTKQPAPGDTDLDGCADEAENGAIPQFGGRRNYQYFWDFFDVWTHPAGDPIGWERNAVINIFDILAVAIRFGPGPSLSKQAALAAALTEPVDDTSYHAAYDRGPIIGALNWERGPPDGSINIVDDILGVAAQFGHNCG